MKKGIIWGHPTWLGRHTPPASLTEAIQPNNVKLPPWNMDSRWDFIAVNFELLNMYFMARQNQKQKLNLPQCSKLCSVKRDEKGNYLKISHLAAAIKLAIKPTIAAFNVSF